MLWYPLYSSLLLGSYCFVYLVVFRVRYRELGTYDFVLFVFSGLIPYLGFSEAVSTGLGSVKANLALLAERGLSDRARARQARAGRDGRSPELAGACCC